MKIDAIICTKDPSRILPQLWAVLTTAAWVNSIIVETSKPLSLARKRAAAKASTDILFFVDDDAEIPPQIMDILLPHMVDGVVAVDSRSYNWNVHEVAYNLMFLALQRRISHILPMFRAKGWDNRAYIVRRSAVLSWDAPPCFYSEDELFYIHARKLGKWVQLPYAGVKHHGTTKSYVPFAYNIERYQCYRTEGSDPLFTLVKLIMARLFVSTLAIAYSHTPMTFLVFLRFCVHTIAGTLMAKVDRL